MGIKGPNGSLNLRGASGILIRSTGTAKQVVALNSKRAIALTMTSAAKFPVQRDRPGGNRKDDDGYVRRPVARVHASERGGELALLGKRVEYARADQTQRAIRAARR